MCLQGAASASLHLWNQQVLLQLEEELWHLDACPGNRFCNEAPISAKVSTWPSLDSEASTERRDSGFEATVRILGRKVRKLE